MKALIVDDERPARSELRRLLSKIEYIGEIEEAANGDQAVEIAAKFLPDVLFMDVQMPGKNGFETVEAIKIDPMPDLVFTTAYDEYALKAFDFGASDYLLKPIESDRLKKTLDRIADDRKGETQEETQEETDCSDRVVGADEKIFIKDGSRCFLPTLSDVRLFESVGNYVQIHFGINKPLILRSLNALEKRLDGDKFFRAGRKYIVNLDYVEKVEPYFSGGLIVFLSTGEKVEISRRQAVKFKNRFSL